MSEQGSHFPPGPSGRLSNAMKDKQKLNFLARAVLMGGLVLAARLQADTVETADGAKIVGKITKIHGGVITLDTDYAGEINVKQVLVTRITTDHPVAVRFADGTGLVGTITSPGADKIRVTSPAKAVDSPVGNLSATWAAGEEDPDVAALRRKWSYEAAADIDGRAGTNNALATSYSFRAKLVGPLDTFQYYTNYTRQETQGQVSADQFKVGADYADNFAANTSWYVRDEGGFDRVNDIKLYDVAATGFGYDFVKDKQQTLTGRAGVSYRYDQYTTPDTANLSSAGADLELEYTLKLKKFQLSDRITFVPAFQDLGNYILTHDFEFEIPITKSLWKLSTGVTNNYNSRPVGGVDRLDTLYFTRLVLAWGEGQAK
jgi:putative salt-induced outer membrane protein YdiY